MIILFIHKSFPGQFKYLAPLLAQDTRNVVLFLSEDDTIATEAGINKIVFEPAKDNLNILNPCLKGYGQNTLHARGAAGMMLLMKQQNIIPDIIVAHNGDIALFAKDVFPKVPLICYCEWFDDVQGSAITFGGKVINENFRQQLRCDNASKIDVLARADGCISPTQWQKQQFPKCFHDKIKVLYDGVDTDIVKPDENAVLEINGKKFTKKDKVITYATRGMEPMRGFPEFMKAAEILLKKHKDIQIIVGGNDRVFYGKPLKSGTYKQKMLRELDLDLSRLHFCGGLDFSEYIKMLQITSAHVYATYPFILSWSLPEAMSAACPIVASSTEPVLEVMEDNFSGLLFDFYDVEMLVKKIEYALENPNKMKVMGENARKVIIEKFDLKKILAQQIIYLQGFIKGK